MSRPDSTDGEPSEGRPKKLLVVSSRGVEQRFLRGMITHDLVKRGIEFEQAYAIAGAVRDRCSDRERVNTSEIRDLIQQELEVLWGPDLAPELRVSWFAVPGITVIYEGHEQPFSKGVLAGSIHAAGVDLDRAYRLVTELEAALRAEGVASLSRADLARRVDQLLERSVGKKATRRYRAIRRIHRLPRPVVVYIGGASGTGKSSLALDLAPLLRIYRVTATDTVRQVMRMVFTPNILPALHRSTFETPGPHESDRIEMGSSSGEEPDSSERLLTSYDEQATRVCVGVRAVVERAIAENMSIIVEGVHLRPGIVPFADLEGVCYQVPMVLAALDPEAHRVRLLARAPAGERRAERYLEAFRSIRLINDHLLQLAEANDVPLVDTFTDEQPALHTVQLVAGVLERRVPALASADWIATHAGTPTLLLIIDGLADRPIRALGGRTPLQAADTPCMERLAREGQVGLADPIAPGVVPDTAAGTLALFGQSPQALQRGPVEALGAGLELRPDDIALRGNFATLDDRGYVVDRRAGRIREETEELAAALDRMALPRELEETVEVRVRAATEHRLAIVLRAEGLSPAIQGSDPGDGAAPGPALTPSPLDPSDARAVHTARVLGLFELAARDLLREHPINKRRQEKGLPPANAVLTRGAGRIHRLISLEEAGLPMRLCCISGDRTVLGLARWLGAETITAPEMTANLDTDLESKFDAVTEALDRFDLIILHLKGADIASHDRRPDLKVDFLERIDAQLAKLIERRGERPFRIAVGSDHATLSESGQHGADPLPILIWGEGIEADDVNAFDEQSAAAGSLQRFPLQALLGRLFQLS